MSTIIPFQSPEFSVRAVEIEGNPWFIGMDVADQLDYSDTEALTRRLDDDDKQNLQLVGFGPRGVTVISESGLYAAILGSTKAEAKRFKRWVTSDVLPTIRKTGQYAQPKTQAELLLASAQAMVDLERRQQVTAASVARVEHQVQDLRDTMLMSTRPQNAEAISHIRPRIWQKYGLPSHIVDVVLRQLPYSPKPAGMVRNTREEAEGATYAVYWTKDVNAVFARFVKECERVTPAFVVHPHIQERFRLAPGAEGGAA